ncbi:MAG: NAD-dependent epimerase/dehydratase family protein [Chloroflexi bacterium]|nr:MAG: NAD-dependent epimerase/dehydratase family protein [Chloroflexota bacterium]
MLENKTVLVTGGTGSLGKVLIRRLLTGEMGMPKKIIIFSRDEAKQHAMRVEYLQKKAVTDEVIYQKIGQMLDFRIGDVRDFHSVSGVLHDADVVFNTAALKQVPTCEYFPFQAVMTNIAGPENIIRAIQEQHLPIETVVGISTDKAAKPVNVMGMTKALQERVFIQANMRCPQTRFICVRYGNVLASRGSVIPLFHEQIQNGGPVTITTTDMTRFLLSLDQAVDTIFAAVRGGQRGEMYIPRVPSAKVVDIASILIEDRPIKTLVTGIRPGEKIHEILVSEEERFRTFERGNFYVIAPILPELRPASDQPQVLDDEYSSAHNVMDRVEVEKLLRKFRLMVGDPVHSNGELIR